MEHIILATPLAIGLMHCLEPDHLLAVSALVKKKEPVLLDVARGVSWGVGHSVPVLGIGLLYILFSFTIQTRVSLELPVGIMLAALGLVRLRRVLKADDEKVQPASYLSFLMVGVVHGLAGTAGIVVLLAGLQPGIFNQLSFLLWFCLGLTFGMGMVAGPISRLVPLMDKVKLIRVVVPVASLIYGLSIIYQNI